MKKAETINLQGQSYAKVAERIRIFREECPRGTIETTPEFPFEGQVLFKARVCKDGSDTTVACATGHSIGKYDNQKAFEKQESIAIGRALANLGYLASGEIASAEEMLEYEAYKEGKEVAHLEALQELVDKCTTEEELRELYNKHKITEGAAFAKMVTARKNQLTI